MDLDRNDRTARALALALLIGLGLAAIGRAQEPAAPSAAETPGGEAPPSFRLPDDRLGTRVSPILLLSREDVRTDLRLDDYQFAQARQAIAELYEQAATLRGKTGPEVVSLRRQVDEACQGWIRQWLSETQQLRLEQVDLQWEGPSALVTRPTLGASLELNERQRADLAEAVRQRNAARAQGKAILEAERLLGEKTLAILGERQRDRWKAMLGQVFQPSVSGLDSQVVPTGDTARPPR